MAKHALLSHEETMELIAAAQEGSEEAQERLVECNTRLIWNVVYRYKNRGYDLEDLFQIGAIGLLKGINKFDMTYGVRFTTYAVPMISGEILRFLRDDGVVKVSRNMKELAQRIKVNELVDSTPEHIAEVLDVADIEYIKETIQYIKSGSVKSLEETAFSSGDSEDITIAEQQSGDVNGDNWLNHIALRDAFEKLTDRERRIMGLRYFKDRTQGEVAAELEISQVQVSRLERKILVKMKELLEEETDMPKDAKGNRVKAIELLKTTSMPHHEISDKTGVPVGSLGVLAKKYRDPEVSEKNKVKFNAKKEKDMEINTAGTKTGRFKSSEPNVAATPNKAEEEVEVIDLYARRQEEKAAKEAKKAEQRRLHAEEVQKAKPVTKAVSQTISVEEGDIVVTNENGEEAFRVQDKGATLVAGGSIGVNPIEPVTNKPAQPAVAFSFNVGAEGVGVSKEQALESLRKATEMVKMVPSETVSFFVKVSN